MKPQTLFVLVSLIGMLLTPQQIEGVLDDEAVQANGNIGLLVSLILLISKFNCSHKGCLLKYDILSL